MLLEVAEEPHFFYAMTYGSTVEILAMESKTRASKNGV
jgi:hypothetical protein